MGLQEKGYTSIIHFNFRDVKYKNVVDVRGMCCFVSV